MVCYQCLIWTLAGFRLTRLIVMAVVGTGLVGLAIVGFLPDIKGDLRDRVRLGILAVLVALAAGAYAGALLGVERQRHGGGRGRNWWRALGLLLDVLPRRRKPFAAAHAAQGWLEWRQGGVVLPFCVAVILLLVIGPILWLGGQHPDLTVWTLGWAVVLPPLLAVCVGYEFARPNFWSGQFSLAPFVAVRPLATGELLLGKLRAAAWSTLAAWALVLTLTPLWLALGSDMSLLVKWGRTLGQQYHTWTLLLMAPLVLLAAMILTWRMLIVRLPLGLCGRPLLFLGWECACGLGVIAVIVLLVWLQSRVDRGGTQGGMWSKPFFEYLPAVAWLLYVLFLGKVWLAAWAWNRACRQGLLSRRAAWAYLGVWAAATACLILLVSLVFWPAQGDDMWPPLQLAAHISWLRHLLILGALLVVPLARPGLAPLALAWNRHR
jgi:hypothetical protein